MSIHKLYGLIFKWTRRRRMAKFSRIMAPSPQWKVLDVGGDEHYWHFLPATPDVLMLNIRPPETPPSHPRVRYAPGDALAMTYENEFDLVFSNSVIEHVGDLQAQQRFADRCRAAGKRLWVQTPAKVFPIEPHYLTFFIHWLPRRLQKKLLPYLSVRGLMGSEQSIDSLVDEIRLLRKPELKRLFPDCQILTERFLFLPKSYIVVRK